MKITEVEATPEYPDNIAAVPSRLRLEFLDGIRGLAAMLVIFHHFIGLNKPEIPRGLRPLFFWAQFGHLAVNVFIVISGYCLMLPVLRSTDGHLRGGIGTYFARRARRILPPYYAALGLSLLALLIVPQTSPNVAAAGNTLHFQNPSVGDLLSHALLFHNLFPQWFLSINLSLWSIGTEWQIYFVFPFLLLPLWRRYGNKAALLAGSLVGLPFPLLFPHLVVINVGCLWYIGLFTMGMVGAALSFRPSARTKAWQPYLPMIILALCVLYIGCKYGIPEHYTPETGFDYRLQWVKDYVAGLTAMCLLVYCTGLVHRRARNKEARRSSIMLRVLETPRLVFLGTFSYSMYLIHGIILNIVNSLFSVVDVSPAMRFLVRLCAGIPLSVVCAYLFFLLVERRFLSAPATTCVQAEQKQLSTQLD